MQEHRTARDGELVDICGRRRSPATYADFHRGRVPRNRGQKYPPDPPTVPEIVALLKACDDAIATADRHPTRAFTAARARALMVLLWRTGLRASEALDLYDRDLDATNHSVVVRRGKGGKRRVVGMDGFGWNQIEPWLKLREDLPPDPVFCVVDGPTVGRQWNGSSMRMSLHRLTARAGLRKRITPHSFRHAHACELAREKVRIHLIQRQLGHAHPGVTAIYLQAIANPRPCPPSHRAADKKGPARCRFRPRHCCRRPPCTRRPTTTARSCPQRSWPPSPARSRRSRPSPRRESSWPPPSSGT